MWRMQRWQYLRHQVQTAVMMKVNSTRWRRSGTGWVDSKMHCAAKLMFESDEPPLMLPLLPHTTQPLLASTPLLALMARLELAQRLDQAPHPSPPQLSSTSHLSLRRPTDLLAFRLSPVIALLVAVLAEQQLVQAWDHSPLAVMS